MNDLSDFDLSGEIIEAAQDRADAITRPVQDLLRDAVGDIERCGYWFAEENGDLEWAADGRYVHLWGDTFPVKIKVTPEQLAFAIGEDSWLDPEVKLATAKVWRDRLAALVTKLEHPATK